MSEHVSSTHEDVKRWLSWLEQFLDPESGGEEIRLNAGMLWRIFSRAETDIKFAYDMWHAEADARVKDEKDRRAE